MIAPLLFTWLQGADFYRDLHSQAVASLPLGGGKIWLDIGCGPGLMTRLAAASGYQATGLDADARMVRTAQRLAQAQNSAAQFAAGKVEELPYEAADVVSAASLLAVLEDKPGGLAALWQCVRPGGKLLVIEPTGEMTLENAKRIIAALPKKRVRGLMMWAAVRQGRTVNPQYFTALDTGSTQVIPLLLGLVGAHIFTKKQKQ